MRHHECKLFYVIRIYYIGIMYVELLLKFFLPVEKFPNIAC